MRVEITCANRVGILHEIMQIFTDYRINVTSGELGGDSGDKVYLSAPGMLATQYQTIEKSLLSVPGIKRVRRIALIPSERRHFELDTLLRHVAEPVLSVDREGQVIAANLAAERAFGVSLDQVPGMQLQRLLPLMQVVELLRDFAVPRYGMPVSVRGKAYRMEWSPIALADGQGIVDSLAGAVLTLQPGEQNPAISEPLEPVALWNFDKRRSCCLQLQELARLGAPLLIIGERGSGKSSFAAALHYLSPSASSGDCYRLQAGWGESLVLPANLTGAEGTLLLEDLHRLKPKAQQLLARQLHQLPGALRLVATCTGVDKLVPALAQVFSSLALHLPPLRSMRPALEQFAAAILREMPKDQRVLELDVAALERLRVHDWPDNFSGLWDHLRAAASYCHRRGGATIAGQDLPELVRTVELPWRDWSRGLSYREMMEQLERALFTELVAGQPSTRELARRLGISHTAVANKLRKYGLAKPRS